MDAAGSQNTQINKHRGCGDLMKLFNWLRKLLRKWLLDAPELRQNELELADGKIITVVRTCGMALLGNEIVSNTEGSVRLLLPQDVRDKKKFWRLWSQLKSGMEFRPDMRTTWESDGMLFDPVKDQIEN